MQKPFFWVCFLLIAFQPTAAAALQGEEHPSPVAVVPLCRGTSLHWVQARTFHPLQLVLWQSLFGFGNNTVVISARNFADGKLYIAAAPQVASRTPVHEFMQVRQFLQDLGTIGTHRSWWLPCLLAAQAGSVHVEC